MSHPITKKIPQQCIHRNPSDTPTTLFGLQRKACASEVDGLDGLDTEMTPQA